MADSVTRRPILWNLTAEEANDLAEELRRKGHAVTWGPEPPDHDLPDAA